MIGGVAVLPHLRHPDSIKTPDLGTFLAVTSHWDFPWAYFVYRWCYQVMLPPSCTYCVWNSNAIFYIPLALRLSLISFTLSYRKHLLDPILPSSRLTCLSPFSFKSENVIVMSLIWYLHLYLRLATNNKARLSRDNISWISVYDFGPFEHVQPIMNPQNYIII